MTKVDQFESVFRAAAKPVFVHQEPEVGKILVITDLEESAANAFGESVRSFLKVLDKNASPVWRVVTAGEFRSVGDLLELVAEEKPDLVCTYRHLHSEAWKWPYSLGESLDVLTQATPHPICVLPHPEGGRALEHAMKDTNQVMAITDHLVGNDLLVNFALAFVERETTLFLTHIEDQRRFDRLMDIISKIASIDTETAREEIMSRLLKEPRDYIATCKEILEKEGKPVRIQEIVTVGNRLSDYKKLVEDHRVDLLVLNTKDEDQLAMHGMAYPLAVELRQIPLLML